MRVQFLTLTAGLGACLGGCAGPTTPLGAVWTVTVPNPVHALVARATDAAGITQPPVIDVFPSRQNLHASRPIILTIDDPAGKETGYEIAVTYNGLDVSSTFMKQARVKATEDGHRLTIKVPRVSLAAGTQHKIEFSYRSPSGSVASIDLEPPVCSPFTVHGIVTTAPFSPPKKLIRLIDRVARESGFNPAFAAGLVAQESGFNSRSVSWARAIGLTQITPVAQTEISSRFEHFEHWPRYPGLSEYSLPWVKGMIVTGKLNRGNEWRLDEKRSVRGGLAYTEYLYTRWATPENKALIEEIFKDHSEEALSKLVLASYNSGYTRVRGALIRERANWLEADELRGIRKYVDRIVSYCDHFGDEGAPG